MAFPDFLATIGEPALVTVAQHWDAARGSQRMPSWSDIDPAAIPHQLPIVWSWRWDAARDDFVGRLAGNDIERAMGGSLRGRCMLEVFGHPAGKILRDRYREVMQAPEVAHSLGSIYNRLRRSGSAERIVMPLASDRSSDGGVFGATVYRLGAAVQDQALVFDQEVETRRTFPL